MRGGWQSLAHGAPGTPGLRLGGAVIWALPGRIGAGVAALAPLALVAAPVLATAPALVAPLDRLTPAAIAGQAGAAAAADGPGRPGGAAYRHRRRRASSAWQVSHSVGSGHTR